MKKLTLILFSLFIYGTICATPYKISKVDYDITGAGFKFLGKTNEEALNMKFPIDTKTVFQTKDDLIKYLDYYISELDSSRTFDSVEYSFEEIASSTDNVPDINNELVEVFLHLTIVDSHHFLTMPYPKYSSNDGLIVKFKVKDTNFLGSLNTLNSEINFELDTEQNLSPGFNLSYDFPFQLGNFNCEWVNDYSISYTTGETIPEWNLKTGLTFLIPFNGISLKLEAYQYFINNLDYTLYKDAMYYAEEFLVSLPISLYKFENFSKLYYTPSISFNFNWDLDHININNNDLASPNITFGHSLTNSKIIWENCFRSGYDLSLKNTFTYNFQRNDFSPYLGFESLFYYNFVTSENRNFFDQYGITLDFYAFLYFYNPLNTYIYGEKIGSRLRGIRDNQFFGNESPSSTSSSAFMLSLDLPHHIFTTNFSKEIINFNFQISPFLDVALIYNRRDNKIFSIKDGLYCAGVEFLVYPLKWSSYTIRASAGYDVKNLLKGSGSMLSRLKHPEIFIGIGLQY